MKCEIEVELPEDIAAMYEPVAFRQWRSGDSFLNSCNIVETAGDDGSAYRLILREKWTPPTWLKAGWIAKDYNGAWFWYPTEPQLSMDEKMWCSRGAIHIDPNAFNFTPPSCDDFRQSKRRIN